MLKPLGGRTNRIASLPLAGGWTAWRDLPAPQGRTFFEQWKDRQQAGGAK